MDKTITTVPSAPRMENDIHVPKKVKTEIILGSPSTGCQGVGICRVMPHGQGGHYKCQKTTAWLGTTEDGKLRISFWKASMDPRYMRRHFGWMLFQVYETYEIPARVTRHLSEEKIRIQPGIYSVWDSGRYLVVDL